MGNYKEEVRKMLGKATLSEPWENSKNQTVYALMMDGEIIGHIKENVDLSKLIIGEEHKTWRGRKVELIYNNKLIGIIWV